MITRMTARLSTVYSLCRNLNHDYIPIPLAPFAAICHGLNIRPFTIDLVGLNS